jgi:hypothetical protein
MCVTDVGILYQNRNPNRSEGRLAARNMCHHSKEFRDESLNLIASHFKNTTVSKDATFEVLTEMKIQVEVVVTPCSVVVGY